MQISRESFSVWAFLTSFHFFFILLCIKIHLYACQVIPSAWIYNTLLPHSSVPLHKEVVRLSIMVSVGQRAWLQRRPVTENQERVAAVPLNVTVEAGLMATCALCVAYLQDGSWHAGQGCALPSVMNSYMVTDPVAPRTLDVWPRGRYICLTRHGTRCVLMPRPWELLWLTDMDDRASPLHSACLDVTALASDWDSVILN